MLANYQVTSMDVKVENESMGEEGEGKSWGTSLPVESVQEIVRNDPTNIPDRYLWTLDDHRILPHLSSAIPVIDLSMLSTGNDEELKLLEIACRDWGFFQIINHGIPTEVLQKVKHVAAKFFELPLEHKKRYSMPSNDIQGYGQVYVVSEQQKLNWGDAFILLTHPAKFRKLRFWPSTPSDFTEAVEMYSNEVNTLAKKIFTSLSMLLGVEKEYIYKLHNEMAQGLRVNYYPTCCKPDKVMGVSPHSDSSTITVLLQDDDVTGLEIKHCGGWVPVEPIPNALVLNVGDVLEVLSNGRYKSIEHRAMTNESKARISIASFIIPEADVEIKPMEMTIECKENGPRYRKIPYGEYLSYTTTRELDGKSNVEFLKL